MSSFIFPLSDTVNVVASDHRPFTTKQKAMGKEDFTKIPHGVSGVQDRMAVIWERGVVSNSVKESLAVKKGGCPFWFPK